MVIENQDVVFLAPLKKEDLNHLDIFFKEIDNFEKDVPNKLKESFENCWLIKEKIKDSIVGLLWLSEGKISEQQKTLISIKILSEHKRKRYAEKALNMFVKYAFNTMKLQAITAVIHRLNEPSLKLFQKNGFEYKEPDSFRAGWLFDVYELINS